MDMNKCMRILAGWRLWSLAGLGCTAAIALAFQHRPAATLPDRQVLTVHPAEISDPLPNPYMGLGLWAGPWGFGNTEKAYTVGDCTTGFGDNASLFNWVLIDWDWSSLEPAEGRFSWSDFDTIVQYWAARRKQVVVRFWVTDDPGWNGHPGRTVLPQWLWANGLKGHSYLGQGGKMNVEPDYSDPSYLSVFLPALQGLLESFATRYDRPGTPIIFLQAMGYGHWADFATWYSKYQFPSPQAKRDTLARLVRLYIHTFHHIPLLQMAGSDSDEDHYSTLDDFMHSKALDIAVANHFGFIWTGFIDGNRGRFTREIMEASWHTDPVIAEGSWNYDEMKDQLTHGTVEENIEGAGDYHANFFHLYFVPQTYQRAMREDRSALESALQAGGIGYRLLPTLLSWPRQLAAGRLLVLHQEWINRNVGRLYVSHPLTLYLTTALGKEAFSESIPGFDESQWVRGQTYSVMSVFHLSRDIPPGEYNVLIALADGSGKPAIRLAIAGEDSMHRYSIGHIRITPPDETSPNTE